VSLWGLHRRCAGSRRQRQARGGQRQAESVAHCQLAGWRRSQNLGRSRRLEATAGVFLHVLLNQGFVDETWAECAMGAHDRMVGIPPPAVQHREACRRLMMICCMAVRLSRMRCQSATSRIQQRALPQTCAIPAHHRCASHRCPRSSCSPAHHVRSPQLQSRRHCVGQASSGRWRSAWRRRSSSRAASGRATSRMTTAMSARLRLQCLLLPISAPAMSRNVSYYPRAHQLGTQSAR